MDARARVTLVNGLAPGTRKNLRGHYRSFTGFLQAVGWTGTISVRILQRYIQYLSEKGLKATTIANYVAGVKFWVLLQGGSTGVFDSIIIKLMLKGVARLHPHMPRQALPITIPILLDFHRLMDMKNPFQASMWALFLIAFFLMCRKSNLTPESAGSFDSAKQFVRGQFQFRKNVMLVTVRWTKTIQFGERKLVIPLVESRNSPLCPVHAFKHMCSLVPAGPMDPAFCVRRKGILCPITYGQFSSCLKKLILQSSRDPAKFSSHSFRRGGASFAYQAGLSAELVKLWGDWKSDAFYQYLQVPMELKAGAAYQLTTAVQRELISNFRF